MITATRRSFLRPRRRLAVFALSALAATASAPALLGPKVLAQAPAQNACGLLTRDEVQAIVPKDHIDEGVAQSIPSMDFSSCSYAWGVGIDHVTLSVSVNPASRMFPGKDAEGIRRSLADVMMPGSHDAVLTDVGQAAIFKAYSPLHVRASAYLKDRVVQIDLGGMDAVDRKDDVTSLLKKAAARL